MMASELDPSHSVFSPSHRYGAGSNPSNLYQQSNHYGGHRSSSPSFPPSSPPDPFTCSVSYPLSATQIQSILCHPTTVFIAGVSSEDGSCGCPYVCQSSTVCLPLTSLPKSLEGLYTYSQYSSFVQRLNGILRQTHCPLCPCSFFIICLPFSPLCATIYCRSQRIKLLKELIRKENAQSPLVDQGLEWVLTYHPEYSTLDENNANTNSSATSGGGGVADAGTGNNSVENSRHRSVNSPPSPRPNFSAASSSSSLHTSNSIPSRSFAVLRIIPTLRSFYEAQHPEVRQLMTELSTKRRAAEFEAACMAEIDAEMIEEGLLSSNSNLAVSGFDRTVAGSGGVGGWSRNRTSNLNSAGGGGIGAGVPSTVKLTDASSQIGKSFASGPPSSSNHTNHTTTNMSTGYGTGASAPPPAVMGERMDAAQLAKAMEMAMRPETERELG